MCGTEGAAPSAKSMTAKQANGLLVAEGIGMVGGAISSILMAGAQKSAMESQARIGEINAKASERAAGRALQAGAKQEQKLRLEAAQIKSRQRAAMAANNVDLSEGSALNTQNSTDYMTETDALTIQLNAEESASGYRSQAASQRMGAAASRGAAEGVSPFLSGSATLLTGATSLASRWYGFKQSGAMTNRKKG
jgi:hypothetical protein